MWFFVISFDIFRPFVIFNNILNQKRSQEKCNSINAMRRPAEALSRR